MATAKELENQIEELALQARTDLETRIRGLGAEPDPSFNIPVEQADAVPDINIPEPDVDDIVIPDLPEDDLMSDIADLEDQREGISDVQQRILDLQGDLGEREVRRQELLEEQGIPGALGDLGTLTGQLQLLKAEREGLQLKRSTIETELQKAAEGRGMTKAGLAPKIRSRLRDNQIQQSAKAAEQLMTLAKAQNLRGNIELANNLVDRSIAAEFAPIEADLKIKGQQLAFALETYKVDMSDVQRRKIERQQRLVKEQETRLREQKENRKLIEQLALQARKNGADDSIVRNISNARDFGQALLSAGDALQDPTIELQREKLRQDIANSTFGRRMQVEKLALQKREAQAAEALVAQEAAREDLAKFQKNEDAIFSMDQQLENLQSIMDNTQGMKVSSGVLQSPFLTTAAFTTSYPELVSTKNKFLGQVGNLLAEQTFSKLADVTSRTTLGQISNAELTAIGKAATTLRNYAIVDENDKVTGFNVSDDLIMDELIKIQENWSRARDKYSANRYNDDTQMEAFRFYQSSK